MMRLIQDMGHCTQNRCKMSMLNQYTDRKREKGDQMSATERMLETQSYKNSEYS